MVLYESRSLFFFFFFFLGPSTTSNESEDSSEWNAQYNAMESTQQAFQEKNSTRILVKL